MVSFCNESKTVIIYKRQFIVAYISIVLFKNQPKHIEKKLSSKFAFCFSEINSLLYMITVFDSLQKKYHIDLLFIVIIPYIK